MIVIEPMRGRSVAEQRVEIVERKGVGHPDHICDAVMESISVALSHAYLAEFGTVLHHNIDKGLLAAGRVRKAFGGGKVLKPMRLFIGDRATFAAGGSKVPVPEIAVGAAKAWIRDNLRFVDPDRHVQYSVVLAPGSTELTDIFARAGAVRSANDTSAAVGYYPLSPTEQVVLALEHHVNSPAFKARHPDTGEDVKVMGLRTGRTLDVTVAMPLLARAIESESAYFHRKQALEKELAAFLARRKEFTGTFVHLNALDVPGRGLGGVYLSLLGTSAEDADSGQVGRGNRVNGLIALNRPLGTEAAAGKNPVSHVGKIYNVLAHRLARRIYEGVEGLREVYVLLLSRIGMPVDEPQMVSVQLRMLRGRKTREVAGAVQGIVEGELGRLGRFCSDLSKGKYPIC